MTLPEDNSPESGRKSDWSFSFADDEVAEVPAPPGAVAGELEFSKATLQHDLAGLARTSLHLESLIRRAHREGMSVDDLAVYAGISVESVIAVVGGASLVDQLFQGSPKGPEPR